MTVTIKLTDQSKPLKFFNVFKMSENQDKILLWFEGEWNTPRSWDRARIDGTILVEV